MGIVLNHDQYAAFEERVLSYYRRNPGTAARRPSSPQTRQHRRKGAPLDPRLEKGSLTCPTATPRSG